MRMAKINAQYLEDCLKKDEVIMTEVFYETCKHCGCSLLNEEEELFRMCSPCGEDAFDSYEGWIS